jgi:hypothetical protein
MIVKELREALKNFPEDLAVIVKVCSDYGEVDTIDFEIVKAVDKGYYIMRSHPTMALEWQEKEKEYLLIQ